MTRSNSDRQKPRVAMFVTCMVDALYPGVGMAAVELLERHGAEVVFPEDQTCCGQPAFNAGYRDEARRMARHFLDVFGPLVEKGEVDAIVAPSGSCVAMVKHFYEVLFEGPGHDNEQRLVALVSEVTYELTQYLVDVLGIQDVEESTAARSHTIHAATCCESWKSTPSHANCLQASRVRRLSICLPNRSAAASVGSSQSRTRESVPPWASARSRASYNLVPTRWRLEM